jgi:hypothetical protein
VDVQFNDPELWMLQASPPDRQSLAIELQSKRVASPVAEVYLENGIAMIEVHAADETAPCVLRVDDLITFVTAAVAEITRSREDRIVDLSKFEPPNS